MQNPAEAIQIVDGARRAFVTSGGATNVADRLPPTGEPGVTNRNQTAPGARYLSAVAIGLATLFITLTLLDALSIVRASGSMMMQVMGDADTICFDITVMMMAALTWRLRRAARSNTPYLMFSLSLAAVLTGLMAYVVTNVGTLVRLRLMLMVPLWTMTFAFAKLPAFLEPDRVPAVTPSPTRPGQGGQRQPPPGELQVVAVEKLLP